MTDTAVINEDRGIRMSGSLLRSQPHIPDKITRGRCSLPLASSPLFISTYRRKQTCLLHPKDHIFFHLKKEYRFKTSNFVNVINSIFLDDCMNISHQIQKYTHLLYPLFELVALNELGLMLNLEY